MANLSTSDLAKSNPMAIAMMAASPAATKAWLGLTTEYMRFTTECLQQGIEAQGAMFACRTPMDLMQTQADYVQKSSQHYADQTSRLFQIMTDATQDTAKAAASSHARRYDDIPL